MNLNDLKPNPGATKNRKRIGRGPGSGQGTTAGRGNNGAKSRAGYSSKSYFEGGQLPLIRKVPKRGFTNIFKKEFQIVNISDIASIAADIKVIDAEVLYTNGLIHSACKPVKLLANGEIELAVAVKVAAVSKAAALKIEAAKGTVEVI